MLYMLPMTCLDLVFSIRASLTFRLYRDRRVYPFFTIEIIATSGSLQYQVPIWRPDGVETTYLLPDPV